MKTNKLFHDFVTGSGILTAHTEEDLLRIGREVHAEVDAELHHTSYRLYTKGELITAMLDWANFLNTALRVRGQPGTRSEQLIVAASALSEIPENALMWDDIHRQAFRAIVSNHKLYISLAIEARVAQLMRDSLTLAAVFQFGKPLARA